MLPPHAMPSLTEPAHTDRRSTSSGTSLTGEPHSAPPAASSHQLSLGATTPASRILAPTQVSAARTTPSSSTHRKPVPSAARLSASTSRLPRRDTSAPTALTGDTKWAARVTQRAADNEASNPSPRLSSALVTDSGRSVSVEKPLPPRPVASVATTASPSKDGRTLVDASEQPLRLSVGDGWPSLTPRSISAPEHHFTAVAKTSASSIPRRTSGTILTAEGNRLTSHASSAYIRDATNSRASGLTGRSSNPSFVSAEESVGGDVQSQTASVVDAASPQRGDRGTASNLSTPNYPPRTHSLAALNSYSDITSPIAADYPDVSTLPDGMQDDVYSPGYESRQQNASPANFSRLRSAMNPHRTSLSSVHTTGSDTDRTASRIPIPGSKKATLVQLQTQNLGSDAEEHSPTFGQRRLISPSALALLDQGRKRRLLRLNTNNSLASDSSQPVAYTGREFRAGKYSGGSSPANTTGASSSDEDEVTTPVSQPSLPRSGSMAKLTIGDAATDRFESPLSSPFDNPRLRRLPPSNSRLTRPLETIPSQSMLIPEPPHLPKSRFSTVAKQLSHAQTKDLPSTDANNLRGANREQLREMLNAVQTEDDEREKDGVPGLDTETKNHLTRTLSQLEGQGTPPSEFVDYDQLQAMFGQITRSTSNAPTSNTYLDNVAAAFKFVERGSVSSTQLEMSGREDQEVQTLVETHGHHTTMDTANSTPAISKWSDSTPSAINDSTELRKAALSSIGFPSATNIPSITAKSPLEDEQAGGPDIPTRNSSPTLGSGKIYEEKKSTGSVRRARENMNIGERGGYASMTKASVHKKTAKTPASESNKFRKAGSSRGRNSGSTSAGMNSPRTRTVRGHPDERVGRSVGNFSTIGGPRPRSKSRTMIDKFTGIFHRREKKSQQIPAPPLPPLELERYTSEATLEVEIDNSHLYRSSPTPPVPAIPALHQSPFGEPRSSSRATNASDQSLSSILAEDHEAALNSVRTLTEKLVSKAKMQTSPERKARLLNFASVSTHSPFP